MFTNQFSSQVLKSAWKHEGQKAGLAKSTILFLVYLGYLAYFTLVPFTVVVDGSVSLSELFLRKFEGLSSIQQLSLWDIWTNIILFAPYGTLLLLLPALGAFPWWVQIVVTVLSAGMVSFLLELCQLFVPRRPSLADVICNTVGAALGASLCHLLQKRLTNLGTQWTLVLKKRRVSAIFLGLYLLIICGVFGVPVPWYFSNWDADFPFQLGNEAGLGRPWHGDMYLVAVYNRALNVEEVKTNFAAGPLVNAWRNRVGQGLLLLYDFSEGGGDIVYDRAAGGTPADLRIDDPGHVLWHKPNGLTIVKDAIIASREPPIKLAAGRLLSSSELSVEAWIVPADVLQHGPARIVSYSKDANHRNFTLGQQGREIVFRLRTPLSGPNGAHPEMRTADQPLGQAVQHLVVTFRDGIETLYVQGEEQQAKLVHGKVAVIDVLSGLLGQEFKWPLGSALIFPLGMCIYFFHSGRAGSGPVIWASLMSALGGLALVMGIRFVLLKAVDPMFIAVGVGSVILSIVMIHLLFATDRPLVDIPSARASRMVH